MRFVLVWIVCVLNLTLLSAMSENAAMSSAISQCLHDDNGACKVLFYEYEAEIASLKECDTQARGREGFTMDCMQMGFVLFGAGRYEEAIWYLKKALDSLEEGGDESYEPMYANHRIGMSYQKLGDMKNAKWYLTLACQEGYSLSCAELKKNAQSLKKSLIESTQASDIIESKQSKALDSGNVCSRSGASGGFIPHER
ncbi:hypothetical protein [uncultured Helicobacter sp.]|uniref:hypothetical protein n=1 Tax=uncultured Helicobacter sp. TaxID=175537 RepID=UPI003750493A